MSKPRQTSFLKPRLTLNAQLFDQKGDRWGGRRRDYGNPPEVTSVTRAIDEALTAMGKTRRYDREEEARHHLAYPEDPELDQFTKATKAQAQALFKDPEGTPIKVTTQLRCVNILLASRLRKQRRR